MADLGHSDTTDSLIAKAADALRGKWPNQHDGDFYGEGVEGDCEHVARTVIEVVAEHLAAIEWGDDLDREINALRRRS